MATAGSQRVYNHLPACHSFLVSTRYTWFLCPMKMASQDMRSIIPTMRVEYSVELRRSSPFLKKVYDEEWEPYSALQVAVACL